MTKAMMMITTISVFTTLAHGKEFPVVDGNITQDDVRKHRRHGARH